MILYKLSKRFDPRTGDELKPNLEQSGGYICDYSGETLKNENKPFVEIALRDISGCEEFWYYDEHPLFNLIKKEMDFSDDFNIKYTINKPCYHFRWHDDDEEDCDNSLHLIREWHKSKTSNSGLLSKCNDIAGLFSVSRYRMLEKLLKEKKITLAQIGFSKF